MINDVDVPCKFVTPYLPGPVYYSSPGHVVTVVLRSCGIGELIIRQIFGLSQYPLKLVWSSGRIVAFQEVGFFLWAAGCCQLQSRNPPRQLQKCRGVPRLMNQVHQMASTLGPHGPVEKCPVVASGAYLRLESHLRVSELIGPATVLDRDQLRLIQSLLQRVT
ncbi:hypothetical protein LIA77_07894 [Sarocladium implicatum]|nr:hypothetical protein LIA77_07894 [Sarocladium implicatum]